MKKSSKTILTIAIVLFIIGIGVGVYFGIQSKQDSDKKIGELENQIAELKNNNVINEVNNNNVENTSAEHISIDLQREGMTEDMMDMSLYSSSLGYEMYYNDESYNVSYHDGADLYENRENNSLILVEKEQISYENKISTLSNYKKTTINGYESVYISRSVEGFYETSYYINAKNGTTYIITTSCPDTPDYIEGVGAILSATVNTFYIINL